MSLIFKKIHSPGNMDGGMSTIAEKSMECVFKGGTSTINQVVDYGEAPTEKGLVLQDGPGGDGDSMAGPAVWWRVSNSPSCALG